MAVIDETLIANQAYAESFRHGGLAISPARKLAVLTCLDARLSVEKILGLKTGDAHIIRNAGGIATEDALRSLIISHHLVGTEEFMIINHTDCGMLKFQDQDLRDRLEESSGQAAVVPAHFHAFEDLESNLRRQVSRVRSHPWIPYSIPVRGFVFDVETGLLDEIKS